MACGDIRSMNMKRQLKLIDYAFLYLSYTTSLTESFVAQTSH